jgi:flagellar motor switch protein FliN/FliY
MTMSEPAALHQLSDETPVHEAPSMPDLRRLGDVPIELTAELGRTHMTVNETLDLRIGSIVPLNRTSSEPVDMLVNGTLVARGEVVIVDEQFGIRITEVVGSQTGADSEPSATADAPAADES